MDNRFIAGLKKDRFLWIAVLCITVLRLAFVPLMGMMPQDAYYFFYSQHLSLSYFDHPPAVAWMLRIFTTVFGRHVFALKLADTVVTNLMMVVFYQLAGYFLPDGRRQRALLLLMSTFMITILSLVSTPDIPLLLMWCLSLCFLYQAIFREKKASWIMAGIFMGLSFDSKYTAVFLPAGLTLFLLLSAAHRRWLFSRWYVGTLLSFGIMTLPVIIWNVQNGFASFRFQSSSRMQAAGSHVQIHPLDFLGVIGHQSAILLPVLFFALVILLWKTIGRVFLRWKRISAHQLFLLSFFVPLFLGFFLLSPFYWVKLNWMMPAYLTGIIWVSIYCSQKWLRVQYIFSLVVHGVLAVEVLFYLVPIRSDDTWVGWDTLASEMRSIQTLYPNHFIFSADDYKTSAVLNFYLNEEVYSVNILHRPALQFDFVGTDLHSLKGRSALFVDSNNNGFRPVPKTTSYPVEINQYFEKVIPLKRIVVMRNGAVVRTFMVYECVGYRP
ncbi:Dolichyl-phosphate-mannose-protein mannosyltransferase [Chitinophaga costaii]|uniref:Dolichyl-phosphate-mannose-protein mannosyltransferase n=1 Tax=Chitinophaga costaii TaxID=1335309 RepID=A0A1C4E011_9BACT|nr:glycosyltransferase family 39 protein [Chitinophaga costaii]SCC36974.1 Dolichyl-phosphate-mannose-protein mannosyltransferase [Chitinophaga costaii]